MTNLIAALENRGKLFWALVGVILILAVGLLDFLTGYEVSCSLFYLIPVSIVSWFGGRRLGIIDSLLSAAVWLLADASSGQSYTNPLIFFWNAFVRFGFFIIVTFLLTALRDALKVEKELSHTDYLTGAVNARFFYKLVQLEIDRSQRYKHPFSVAYFDLDNFKSINDQLGHTVGDKVLITVVNHAKSQLRKSDIIARIGGDEFALLFPETDQRGAQLVITKIQRSLLNEMKTNQWPVTFSTGLMTFLKPPETPDELIKMVDSLMYEAKNSGKNSVNSSVYTGSGEA